MRFSIIIPVYNMEKYLRKCIDSILNNQLDNKDCEIILVDDGSTDNSVTLCDAYAKKYKFIRVIHKPNGRLVSARNRGIEESTGEYICYVDADDWVSANWLDTIIEAIEKGNNPDIVVFGAKRVYPDRLTDIIISYPDGYYNKKRLESEVYPKLLSDRDYWPGKEGIMPSSWNKAYKRSLLVEHHCKDEGITRGEDTTFTTECMLYADSLYILNRPVYYYNQCNELSNLSRYDKNRWRAYARLFHYLEEHTREKFHYIESQMNDYYTFYIAAALKHEIIHNKNIRDAVKNVKEDVEGCDLIDKVTLKGLPIYYKIFIALMKRKMYNLVVTISWVYLKAIKRI